MVSLDPDMLRQSLPHVPTGSLVIDYLIGGEPNQFGVSPCPGLPRGRVTQLWGHESAGKTTLALTAAGNVCKAGGTVLYLDWENDIVPDYAAALGVPISDPERFILAQPDTLEDGLKLIKVATLAKVDLVVIDSVGAAVPAAVVNRKVEETGEQQRVGLNAQRWSEFLPEIKGLLAKSGTAMLGISQVRSKMAMGGYGGPSTQPQGGNAWKFYAALRMELRRIATEKSKAVNTLTNKSEDRVYGGVIKAKVVKCKLSSSQGREEIFYIRWGSGIDDVRSIMEIATNHGIIKKAGAWYTYGDTKVQGTEALRTYLRENEDAYAALVREVKPHLSSKGSSEDIHDDEDDDLEAYIRSAEEEDDDSGVKESDVLDDMLDE